MKSRKTLVEEGLKFRRDGCFARPFTQDEILKMPPVAFLEEFQEIYENLCRGDFSGVPKLLSIVQEHAENPTDVTSAATDLIGYVGNVDAFRSMRTEIEGWLVLPRDTYDWPKDQLRSYVRAFENWGRLDVVPFLLEIYLQLHGGIFEMAYLPLTISNLLLASNNDSPIWDEPPTRHLENYLNLVMTEYDVLVEKLGSDKVIVRAGELRSIPTIAKRIRFLAEEETRPSWGVRLRELRSIFEPATGIDCSGLFDDDERALPLDAEKIGGTFLDGLTCELYVDGVRTFFGYRVPDA